MAKEVADEASQTEEMTAEDLAAKMKETWQQMKQSNQDTEKRASVSSALAKQVNETTTTMNKLSD